MIAGLSVKLRHGRALEVKAYQGSPGVLELIVDVPPLDAGPARNRAARARGQGFPHLAAANGLGGNGPDR